ncbi:MAG TPA: DUF6468 domain-containing protein [Phenylobacterium sp.]|nr:DUF6468 domain-containing protein [Phenylobacterium sp.]
MSAIAITMNLLLMALLLAALGMGWQLNQRLKALKDSQAGFAKAVSELDGAAQRAEAGLSDLRSATAEANQVLSERIAMARDLAGKLEDRAAQAAKAPPVREPAPPRAEEPEPLTLARPAAPAARGAGFDWTARPAAPIRQALSRRPAVDDDLFDDAPLALGGRR